MIISEVNAVFDLVVKATTFTTQVQDGWYKGSAELDAFQDKVWILSAKHAQWSEQLQRYGIFENKHLLRLVKAAEEALEKQLQSVRKLQKSPFRRLQKRVFPGQLTYFLDKVLEIVDASPQLLASRVANNDLLDRYLSQTPASLPFGPDRNYVPIADSILAVRNALENSEGPRVVTVYGGPGMGKSSLVKYLAIHYQEEQKRLRMDASFPHGVYYLFCGHDAANRVKQLQLELLENLGFGTGSATPNGDVQEADYTALSSNRIKLRSRLAEQELLVIVDDLWQPEVLQELFVPAKGVRYLVTSQMRDIHQFAEKIQISRPTLKESSQILANYTDGLPTKGEFPHNVKSIVEDILELLQFHPLSLANIGSSINRSRATDTKQWDVIKKHIYEHLDENDYSPPAYDRPYSLPVSASMMLMVESLPADAQRFLFLVALLRGQQLPEPLVKYFFSFIQKNNFLLKYNNHERSLEGKSLVELTVRGDRSNLDIHSMRRHYILDRKKPEVRSIGSQILAASGDQDVAKLIRTGVAEETLVTVLSAMYYDESLKDVVAGTLENHVNLINDGVIPRRLDIETDRHDLVESARLKHYQIRDLVWLLNADHEDDNWKCQAHESAKKIIIKFVCQGKLEDTSVADLLRLPQTTSAACAALTALYHCHAVDFCERNLGFSEAYPETMRTLLDLFHNNAMSVKERTDVIVVILRVLDYESKNYIRKFAAKYEKLFAMKSNNDLSESVICALIPTWRGRGFFTMVEFPGLLESLFAVLVEPGNGSARGRALSLISRLCHYKHLALRIAVLPDALETLFKFFLWGELSSTMLGGYAGHVLCSLSLVPENRSKLGAIKGIWEGLGGIVTQLEDSLRVNHEDLDRQENLKLHACEAAGILGYLALETDLRATIASLPGIREGLLCLQRIEMASQANAPDHSTMNYYYSTRALIVLYSQELADQTLSDIPLIGDLEKVFPTDEGKPSMVHASYFSLYWTRVLACIQIGSYAEGLKNLDLADHHADLVPELESEDLVCQISSLGIPGSHGRSVRRALCDCRIFLQAMVEDYSGALVAANRRLAEYEELNLGHIRDMAEVRNWGLIRDLAERGVLKRLSGELQRGLHDLNVATTMMCYRPIKKSELLWQRGYVKYLMGDNSGAKDDAESAQRLKLDINLLTEDLDDAVQAEDLWQLRKIPRKKRAVSGLLARVLDDQNTSIF